MSKRESFLFVGLACFDVVNVCQSYPEEDTDVRAVDQALRRGGNSSNSCTCFMSLLKWAKHEDAHVEYFGTMAGDVGGEFMERDMKKCGIVTENVVKYQDCLSPVATITINRQNGSRTIVHDIKNLPELEFHQFRDRIDVSKYTWIHFEARENILEILKMIRFIRQEEGDDKRDAITISVEIEKATELRDPIWKEDIDVLFVSKDYAKVKGVKGLESALDVLSKMLPGDKSRPTSLICAWGESGASAAQIQKGQTIEKRFWSPAFPPKQVIDTTGAGDAFIAGVIFARGILRYELQESLKFACRFAGAKCGIFGNEGLDQFEQFLK